MSEAASKTDQQFQEEAFTRSFIEQKIADYALMLKQWDEGAFTEEVERGSIERSLNKWLDELCGVAELRWTPTVEEAFLLANGWRA